MPRLGDEVDDYCSRCKLTTDHLVVSMEGEEPSKVRCRTCAYEHNYRRNRTGRKEMSAKEAFDKVLSSVMNTQPGLQEPPTRKKKR